VDLGRHSVPIVLFLIYDIKSYISARLLLRVTDVDSLSFTSFCMYIHVCVAVLLPNLLIFIFVFDNSRYVISLYSSQNTMPDIY